MGSLRTRTPPMDMSRSSRGILAVLTSLVTARLSRKPTILTTAVKSSKANSVIALSHHTDVLLPMQATLSKWVGYLSSTLEGTPNKPCYAARQVVCHIRTSLSPMQRVVNAHQVILLAEMGRLLQRRTIWFVMKIRPTVPSLTSNLLKQKKLLITQDWVSQCLIGTTLTIQMVIPQMLHR